jgi:putative component of membrane protein insertase Oxa1/YidC/SpoIIIJ protein YidD
MRALLLHLIAIYKRLVSPRKGFSCAYRVGTGRASCSSFAYLAIKRYGAWIGLGLLRRRFKKCSLANEKAMRRPQRDSRTSMRYQSGHCDLPLADCSLSHDCSMSDALDLSDLCNMCSCDLPFHRSWRRKKERNVVIRPNA